MGIEGSDGGKFLEYQVRYGQSALRCARLARCIDAEIPKAIKLEA